MATISITENVTKCKGCHFGDVAGSLDFICTYKRNFREAPRRNLLKNSDIDSDIKRKDSKVLAVFIPVRTYTAGKKPKWCKLDRIVMVEVV